ncbi:MAG: Mrp/NBP35 family ATP-binding protein [Deltaproteobacteria bacterium]|nr:Mrp/NBP35 family ATP-binding protein [Deltaproteobacteria bacterium]
MADCSPSSRCGKSAACSGCSSAPQPLETAKSRALRKTLGGIRNTLFVMSGKGGVGKSAVTVNLAAALANAGLRVGSLDVDMHGPSVPSLLGIDAHLAPRDEEVLVPAYYREKIAVVSMDSLLADRDTAIIWRGPKKTAAINQFLTSVAWGNLDVLLVDSPPGTGDEHLAVLQAIPDARCIMVTTPQEISLADVRKALHFLERIKADLMGLVENMSGLSCPHCGGSIDIFSSGGGEALAKARGIPFFGRIPIDPAMLVAADARCPLVDMDGDFPSKEAFINIALNVKKRLFSEEK